MSGGNIPDQITFDNDDKKGQSYEVHLKHGHTTVDSKDPKTPADIIPGTNQKFPSGVDHDSLHKTITRTIETVDPHTGKTSSTIQTVTLTRSADVDNVTGKVSYGQWSTGKFDATTPKVSAGYTAHVAQVEGNIASQAELASVPAEEVTANTPNETFKVTYSPDQQTANINFVDDDGHIKLANWDTKNGLSDQGPITFDHAVQMMKDYASQGYQFVDITNDNAQVTLDGNTFGEAMQHLGNFDHNDNVDQLFTVHLKHSHVTVDPKDPKTPVGMIPGTDQKFPAGVDHDSLTKTVTRTIIINYPDGSHRTVTQTATFTRNADVDVVTRKVTYGQWNEQSQELARFDAPTVPGYLPDVAFVDDLTVSPTSDDVTVEINYHKVPSAETNGDHQTPVSSINDPKNAIVNSSEDANINNDKDADNAKKQLPQTGDHDSATLAELGMASVMMSMLGLAAQRKRRH